MHICNQLWDDVEFIKKKKISKTIFESWAVRNAGIRPVTFENIPILRRIAWLSNKNHSIKQNKWKVWLENDSKYLKIATSTGSWYEHPLFSSSIVRMDLLSFIKPLKVILTKRFVLIK